MNKIRNSRIVVSLFFVILMICLVYMGNSLLMNVWMSPEDTSDHILRPTFDQPLPHKVRKRTPVLGTSPASSQRVVEYHIDVTYIPSEQKLIGHQVMTWTNPGDRNVNELYVHMYPNAFASTKTSFMKESQGKLRNDISPENNYGLMELVSMHTSEGIDLLPRATYVQPDDQNPNDHTLLQVALPLEVRPQESITLKTAFIVKLPFAFARMGVVGDFVMAGQWFPKFAVYECSGVRGRAEEGWNLHQYHGNSEFYADFGIYNVIIRVPSSYIVAATGFPIQPAKTIDEEKIYHFYAEQVHDFAWSASPHFVYVEESFSTAELPGVKIKLYLDPHHESLVHRYIEVAKKSLAHYSRWYGSYPYSTLSIVVPPPQGNGAGGMEYPTFITTWAADDRDPDLELERVVAHEIGHQYWYGMVANNEFEEAWLDEGFTSYTEDMFMESAYGVKPNLALEATYVREPYALQLDSWKYPNHHVYATHVYTRGKLVLKTIEQRVGAVVMSRILRSYFEQWKFRHPSTNDFQRIVENVTGTDWSSFFESYVYGEQMMDFAVDRIQIITPSATKSSSNDLIESRVFLSKRGGDALEVPVQFHFADGTSCMKSWVNPEASVEYQFMHTSPVAWVRIDPNYTLFLENKPMNNYLKTSINVQRHVQFNLTVIQFIEFIARGLFG